jgi:hypothetical protein
LPNIITTICMDDSVASFSELAPQDSAALDRRTSAANAELEYLLQLRHHLNAAFELFDERCMPILPPANGTIIKRLRRLALQPDGSPMRAALEQVLATGQARVDVFDGLRIAIARIVATNPLRAAVIALAEPADDPKRVPGGRGLELMTGWLAEMVAKPVGAADSGRDTEWRQISAFCRVVSEQAVLGSETAVIHVFIEALAIWDDLDVRAYAAALDQTFSQCVTLNGADPDLAPFVIDSSGLHEDGALTPLTAADMDRLGFAAQAGVSFAHVPDGVNPAWLLVFIGDFPPEVGARIEALINVLGEVLSAARAAEMSRLTWALLQCLVSGLDSDEDKMGRALQVLTAATGRSAGLSITRLDGAVLLSAGDHSLVSWSGDPGVSVRQPLLDSCELLLALAPGGTRHALVRDRRLLDAAASVFGCWTAALLKRDELAPGRRGRERPFDEILQQQIRMARESGTELAVIVVKPGSAPPMAVRKWVREMRGQLRAVDIAVALPTGEVGIVLPGTSLGEATRVVARLQRLCGDDQRLATFASAHTGVVSLAERSLDDASSLMGEARTRAAAIH